MELNSGTCRFTVTCRAFAVPKQRQNSIPSRPMGFIYGLRTILMSIAEKQYCNQSEKQPDNQGTATDNKHNVGPGQAQKPEGNAYHQHDKGIQQQSFHKRLVCGRLDEVF
jgi:hypothetical protein